MLYGVNCSVWFKSCGQHVRLTWWIPTSLDIKSIIISFTSNLSVDDSSCLNSLSLKPVGYITCSSSFVWHKFHLAIQWQTRKRPLSTRMAKHPFHYYFVSFIYFSFTYFFNFWWLNQAKTDVKIINPLHPNISMHILHSVLNTFPKVLTRRICLTIESFFRWWLFPLFWWPSCVIWGWNCKEKFDASHS